MNDGRRTNRQSLSLQKTSEARSPYHTSSPERYGHPRRFNNSPFGLDFSPVDAGRDWVANHVVLSGLHINET